MLSDSVGSSFPPFIALLSGYTLQNLRAVYDRNGAKMVDKEGGVGVDDAAGFFANVFGGERFKDYVSCSRFVLRIWPHAPRTFARSAKYP